MFSEHNYNYIIFQFMLSGNISGKIIESYDVGGYVGFDKYEGDYGDDGIMHFLLNYATTLV